MSIAAETTKMISINVKMMNEKQKRQKRQQQQQQQKEISVNRLVFLWTCVLLLKF